jgi:hypothetical protein
VISQRLLRAPRSARWLPGVWVADEKGNEAYVTIIPSQEPKLRKILEDRVTGLYWALQIKKPLFPTICKGGYVHAA